MMLYIPHMKEISIAERLTGLYKIIRISGVMIKVMTVIYLK